MAVYTGLTRISCSIIMFNATVKNMEMKNYQAKQVKLFKMEYSDEGRGRRLYFSIEGAPKKQGTNSSSNEVLYSLPDGSTLISKNIPILHTQGKSVGHYKAGDLRKVPEDVDVEWLEGTQLQGRTYHLCTYNKVTVTGRPPAREGPSLVLRVWTPVAGHSGHWCPWQNDLQRSFCHTCYSSICVLISHTCGYVSHPAPCHRHLQLPPATQHLPSTIGHLPPSPTTTTCHPTPTIYHRPPTTYYLASTTYHLPLTTYHLPPTTYHPPPTN